ncbi:MAG: DUF4377 domain-containing protein [Candidatus Thiodiazotropha sp. LLP2]
MKKFVCPLCCYFLLSGCDSSDNESDIDEYDNTIYIDHFKSMCDIAIPVLCYRFHDSVETEWRPGIDYIKHFDYEWGYRYRLFVHVKEDTRDVDGVHIQYELLEVVEKRRVESSTLFDFAIPLHGHVSKSDDQSYSLSGEKEIVCSPEHCAALDVLMSQQMYLLLEFTHQEDGEPLLLTQIKCSAPRNSLIQTVINRFVET